MRDKKDDRFITDFMFGEKIRTDGHRLNNLVQVILGNVELLSMENIEDRGLLSDIIKSLQECREIAGHLLEIGRKIS